jgi:hypothetical protein
MPGDKLWMPTLLILASFSSASNDLPSCTCTSQGHVAHVRAESCAQAAAHTCMHTVSGFSLMAQGHDRAPK